MASIDQTEMITNEGDAEMERVLAEMLEADETITARAVARKHPAIKHASSVTRSKFRSELLARYLERQKERREWQQRAPRRSRDQLAAQLAQKDSRIVELERQVEALRVSHLAMIRTVGEMGGISKLLKLYEGYREVRSELDRLGVLPHGEVRPFELGAALGHDVSHSSAHAPEMKPEQKQEQAITPQQEIVPKHEQSYDIGLGL